MKKILNFCSRFGVRKMVPLIKRKFHGEPIFFLKTQDKICFLTVDDAPGEEAQTNQNLLQILKQYNVKATFFVISGQINEKNQRFMHDLLKDGHELGNHMVKNEPMHNYSAETFERNLLECEKILSIYDKEFTWKKLKLFRPPFGKISKEMPGILKKNHYETILGDLYSFDYHINDAFFHIKYLSENISKGSIIILHFPGKSKNLQTLEILKEMIPNIQSKGYKFELLGKFIKERNVN